MLTTAPVKVNRARKLARIHFAEEEQLAWINRMNGMAWVGFRERKKPGLMAPARLPGNCAPVGGD